MLVSKAIPAFLQSIRDNHPGPDLIDRYLEHGTNLETQVMVAADDGFPVAGRRGSFTDGLHEWWHIRIPRKADSEPEFNDYQLNWPIDPHVESIGSTGWDWKARRSCWVGFDFDSIVSHAPGVGVTDEELERVKDAAKNIPWLEVRRSSGGGGLHLYAIFDKEGIECENHTVHAALARSVLGMMSSETGFDFSGRLDVCGHVLWLHSRKCNQKNRGFELLKAATEPLTKLPENWRAHIEVVTHKRSKIRLGAVSESHRDAFESLTTSQRIVPLDETHKKIIEALHEAGFTAIWVQDHHLLQTHTAGLQYLIENCPELNLKGFFKTVSLGKDPGGPNCFLFPLEDGAWRVYRFGPGTVEDSTWEQNGEGYTTCYFNKQPNLKVIARALGGLEDDKGGGYIFRSLNKASEALKALGQKIVLPEEFADRETRLNAHKDGRLIVRIAEGAHDDDLTDLGWLKKKGQWYRIFDVKAETKSSEIGITQCDGFLRNLETPDQPIGWMRKNRDGWSRHPLNAICKGMDALYDQKTAATIINLCLDNPWLLVNRPFETEYPGGRQWNKDAAQFRFQPTDTPGPHPTWDAVLNHCGQDWDEALRDTEWAQKCNIRTGADYLLAWAACLLRDPYCKLPYLFFYGGENCGKTSYHKALSLLISSGVVSGDRALKSEFNGELINAILCCIEETDLSSSKGAYPRLKDWVTNDEIWIRRMRTDSYKMQNCCHFVHTANERDSCPIKFGDTRISIAYVPAIDPGSEIPPLKMKERLESEAPFFMRTIFDLVLPPLFHRLRLPVISNSSKERAEALALNPLEQFVSENAYYVPGDKVTFKEFRAKFDKWMEEECPSERGEWVNAQKIAKSLPHQFPFGISTGNQRCIGNIAWEPRESTGTPYTVSGGRLTVRG